MCVVHSMRPLMECLDALCLPGWQAVCLIHAMCMSFMVAGALLSSRHLQRDIFVLSVCVIKPSFT